MVEVTATEQNIEKRMKKNEHSLRNLWTTLNTPTFTLEGSQKKKEGPEKIFQEIIAENFPNIGKELVNQVQEAQSPRQDKPTEEYTNTHSNQADRN